MPRKLTADNAVKKSSRNVRQVIGANIKARRQTLGWSQQELADRFGVSRPTVSQYEIGTGEVNAGDLPHLAKILGIELLDFYQQPPPVSPQYSGAALRSDAAALRSGAALHSDAALRSGEATPLPTTEKKQTWPHNHSLRVREDGIFLGNHSDQTASRVGTVSNLDMDEIIDLLNSLNALSADDRETVQRVIAAMHHSEKFEPGEPV